MDEPVRQGVPTKERYTYADYEAMPEDGNRYEIVEGELEVSPSPMTVHQFASGRLHLLLERWAAGSAGGLVFYAPLTVYLADNNVVEPDLMWISKERIGEIVGRKIVRGAPDLLVEIISPGSARRDRVKKLRIYAKYGVREYWLVDPESRTVEILALRDGRFMIHACGDGADRLVSSLDPGLEVVPESLFMAFPE